MRCISYVPSTVFLLPWFDQNTVKYYFVWFFIIETENNLKHNTRCLLYLTMILDNFLPTAKLFHCVSVTFMMTTLLIINKRGDILCALFESIGGKENWGDRTSFAQKREVPCRKRSKFSVSSQGLSFTLLEQADKAVQA